MLEAQVLSIHVASSSSLYDRPDFLASLDAQTSRVYQVIHVDLAMGRAQANTEFEGTRADLVRLRVFRNIGVVRGQNQAIALALSRWPREAWSERLIVLSRPEVVFDAHFCETVVRAFSADPTLMIAGPKVFWADAAPQTEGDWIELACSDQLHSAGIGLTRGRSLSFIGQGSQDTGQFDEGKGVLCVSDACVVIRASALEGLALAEAVWLDPHLPPFFAVMDLCVRSALQGVRARLIPEARVWFAPQEQSRYTTKQKWRDTYLPASMRSRTDGFTLKLFHTPWILSSWVRYRVSRLFFSRFWKDRLKLEPGAAESLSALKFLRSPGRAVSVAERRRWFLS